MLNNIVEILKQELPKYSTKFNATQDITTLSFLVDSVTATCVNHGLETGDKITITQAFQKTPITSIIAGIVETSVNNDITTGWFDNIEIVECTITDYNASFPLVKGISKTSFEITTPTLANATDGYVLEPSYFGYNGEKVITVIDADTFTYSASGLAPTAQGGVINNNFRIAGAVDIGVAEKSYSKQLENKYWLFVVPAPVVPNKSRNTTNDATASMHEGVDFRQQVFTPFSLFVFIPSKTDIAGRASYDIAFNLMGSLFKSILNANLDSPLTEASYGNVIFEGAEPSGYTGAYYIHEYKFNSAFDILANDVIVAKDSVAFRQMNLWYEDKEMGTEFEL